MQTRISNMVKKIQGRCMRLEVLLSIFCSIISVSYMMGQDSIPPAEENTGFKSKLTLTANQFSDGSIELNSLLRVKVGESYQALPNEKVIFINVTEDGEEKPLGETSTAVNGKGMVSVQSSAIKADADGYYSFLARFEGNDKIKSSDADLRIHPAKLVAETSEEDSTLMIKLQATANAPDGPMPIAEATVAVYVKRMYIPLKVGEGTTDAEGNVEIEFPNNLPGDQDGNLIITAMIEESDEYGNVAVTMTKPWGYAVGPGARQLPRALWSPLPPAWMVITFFVLMGTVWGNYVIIVFKLFRIRFKKMEAPS